MKLFRPIRAISRRKPLARHTAVVTFTGPPPEERAAAALRRLAEADPRTLADR
ncbi:MULTISPECIES: hypothetical protein [unclassified Streptomyces]|uniref:hypothetical protein n=1 Tax=unclassified Streptomyces TaxID=2593676 RepID=UPI0036A47C5C